VQATVLGGLHGRIINGDGNSAIPSATVTAANGASAVTDDAGHFALSGADADGTLTITAPGYVDAVYYAAVSSSSSITELDDIPLAVTPSSSADVGDIGGHVNNLTSSNITDAVVSIRHGAHNSRDSELAHTGLNCDGNYSFSGVHPGTYTVTVTLGGYTGSTTFTVKGNDTANPAPINVGPSSSR
jgi:hypothetical protein